MMNRIVIIFIISQIITCSAWYNEGHMIVSEIAYSLSNAQTKQSIDNYLTLDSNEYQGYTNHFTASVWADDVKKTQYNETKKWHFIHLPYIPSGIDVSVNPYDEVNIIQQVQALYDEFLKTQDESIRARDLRFLIHLLGDLHHPLHVSSLYSDEFPKGDDNGGLYKIYYPSLSNETCLHSFVDSIANQYNQFYPLPTNNSYETIIEEEAKQILDTCTLDYSQYRFNPTIWANETHSLANLFYIIPPHTIPTLEASKNITILSRHQLCLSGRRLAFLFEELLNRSIPSDFYFIILLALGVLSSIILDEYINRKQFNHKNTQTNQISGIKNVSFVPL
ncbi:hypothetical protein WA158_004641 [Blastocystis sp. Blastoise]